MVREDAVTLKTLSTLTDKIVSDPQHTNEILKILDILTDDESPDILVVGAICSLQKIYNEVLQNSWMFGVVSGNDAISEYRIWMSDTYQDAFSAITSKISTPTESIQTIAFSTSLSFITAETVFVQISGERVAQFIAAVLLSNDGKLVDTVAKEISDLDWKYAALKAIEKFSKKYDSYSDTELSKFTHQLLSSISISECLSDEHTDKKARTDASKTIFHIRKAYNSTWVQFLKMGKSRELYHEILSSLHEKVIPNMQNPKLLIDFLVDSYDLGGTSSLLALNSLFILITKYNLDYPSFYPKLYRMLTPDLFHTQYVPRFISMLDMFLKSPLLPAYLVAAFVKRLTRNALQAPPHVVIVTVRLITNLIKLHPSVKRLVHRGPDHPAVREDPYDANEEDPTKCNALASSLWELEVLNEHSCPGISNVVKTLRKPTDEVLVGLGLNNGYDSLYKEYLKMWGKEPPLEFSQPLNFSDTEFANVFTF